MLADGKVLATASQDRSLWPVGSYGNHRLGASLPAAAWHPILARYHQVADRDHNRDKENAADRHDRELDTAGSGELSQEVSD